MARKNDDVTFYVTYEDGTQDFFTVDAFTLRGGDLVARQIARERQEGGALKPGKIVKVERRN